jgi:hypothetical protein
MMKHSYVRSFHASHQLNLYRWTMSANTFLGCLITPTPHLLQLLILADHLLTSTIVILTARYSWSVLVSMLVGGTWSIEVVIYHASHIILSHLHMPPHFCMLLASACHVMSRLHIKLISSSNHTTSTTISKTRMTRATAKQQRQPTRRIYSQVHHDLPIIIHSAAPSRTTSASLHRRTRFASQNPGLNCPQGRVGISLKALQTWCRWANTRVAPARVKSLHETHPSVGNKTSVVGSVDTENVLSSASNSDVV